MQVRTSAKRRIRSLLEADNWQENLAEIVSQGLPATGALFSFLAHDPLLMHRAARALGILIAKINESDPEAARNLVRRFMWHMNEESGNIGWGIPDAYAETLFASPALADTYSRILNSYIFDLGFDDNFCDHDILRRDCYWAIGRLAEARPELAEQARPWLVRGLADADPICRGFAAWALGKLAPDLAALPALRKLAETGKNDECAVFENDQLLKKSAAILAQEALARLAAHGSAPESQR